MKTKRTQGLVVVLTGNGKGKTTSALGMAMRAVGNGMRVAFVQFIKAWRVGEHVTAERLAPDLEIHRMGLGFAPPLGEGPIEKHQEAARRALEFVRSLLRRQRHDMVIADEILSAVQTKLLSADEVMALLDDRPGHIHLVLTGHGAPGDLIERADLVTEMRLVKHPYEKGVEAQPGIEL